MKFQDLGFVKSVNRRVCQDVTNPLEVGENEQATALHVWEMGERSHTRVHTSCAVIAVFLELFIFVSLGDTRLGV